MANANTAVTLDAVHAAIVAKIAAQYPTVHTVAAYRLDRKSLPLPAILVELTEMEAAPAGDALDPGTGQLSVWARFEARVILGFRTTNAKLEVRKLAAALAQYVHLNRWGVPVGPAEVIGCYEDDFGQVGANGELEQFEIWRVEWRQVIHIGSSVWTDTVTPDQPVYSWVPDVGIGHEADYLPLEDIAAVPDGAP